MIASMVLHARMEKEQKFWLRQRPQSEYIKGIIRGIEICQTMVNVLRQEARNFHPGRILRWEQSPLKRLNLAANSAINAIEKHQYHHAKAVLRRHLWKGKDFNGH